MKSSLLLFMEKKLIQIQKLLLEYYIITNINTVILL